MDLTFLQNFANTNPLLVNILSWFIFGFIVGLVAVFFDPTPSIKGLLSTTILGLLGAFIGGLLSNLLFGVNFLTGFNTTSFIVAVIGTLFLLLLRRLFVQDDRHIKTTIEHKG